MAEKTVKETAKQVVDVVENALVDVKLKLGEIDHDVHFADMIVRFKKGVASVEEAVAKELKKLDIIE